MKVLIVFNHPAPYKVKLFNKLAENIDLDVIFERKKASNRPNAFYSDNVYKFNAIFLKKGAFSKENSNTNELVQYIKQNHSIYDLIIMNGYSTLSEIKAICYMISHKISYSLYVNGGIIRKEFIGKKLLKKYLVSHANYYFSPCNEVDKFLIYYGADSNKINHYVYSTIYKENIIQKPLEFKDKMEIRKQYGLPSELLYVSASQFISRKNNYRLLKIFKENKKNLLLIGSGKEDKRYKRYINKYDLKNITILPFMPKEELIRVLSCCDCFITLSKEDIYGHTTNEAFASGIPVISSNKVISSLGLIKNGINGYVIDLDENLNIYLDKINPQMGQNAIATARDNTIDESCKQHLHIFERICK